MTGQSRAFQLAHWWLKWLSCFASREWLKLGESCCRHCASVRVLMQTEAGAEHVASSGRSVPDVSVVCKETTWELLAKVRTLKCRLDCVVPLSLGVLQGCGVNSDHSSDVLLSSGVIYGSCIGPPQREDICASAMCPS